MSKLFTEQEVRNLLKEILMLSSSVDDAINSLTPIELPTDEEIKEIAFRYNESQVVLDYINSSPYNDFIDGAKWMRDKIKGGNNE